MAHDIKQFLGLVPDYEEPRPQGSSKDHEVSKLIDSMLMTNIVCNLIDPQSLAGYKKMKEF